MTTESFSSAVEHAQHLLTQDYLSKLLGWQGLERLRTYAINVDPTLEYLLPSGWRRIPHD